MRRNINKVDESNRGSLFTFCRRMRKISERRAGLSTKVQNSYLPHVSQGFKSDRDSNQVSPKFNSGTQTVNSQT